MPLITTPPSIIYSRDTVILEYQTTYEVFGLTNHSGYIKVYFGPTNTFLCELKPQFDNSGAFSIDVSNLIHLNPQPPADSALTSSAVTSGLLIGAYSNLRLEVGEIHSIPEVITISDTLDIKVIEGESPYWQGAPTTTRLLHAYYANRPTDNGITKAVLKNSPEFLSVFSPSGGSLIIAIKVTRLSGATSNLTATVSLTEGVNYIAVSPDQLGITQLSSYVYYELTILGNVINYVILNSEPENNEHIVYTNGIGGIETLRIAGGKSYSTTSRYKRFEKTKWIGDTQRQGLSISTNRVGSPAIKCNTGYISADYARHLQQLAFAKIWLIDTARNTFISYELDQDSITTTSDSEELHFVEFTIRRAYSSSLHSNFV